jgi:multidrug efflux system membrane fusion protein
VLAAGVYAALTLTSHRWPRTGRPESPPFSPAVPVVASPARARDVAVYLTGLGSVTPLKTVTIHTRVDGQLMNVKFEEGQLVQRGDLLAEIDPRPFEVLLAQAQGQLLRDQALLENARLDLERYKILIAQDAIPRQQLDTQTSLVRQYEGTVKADQAQIDSARLQLAYCHVTSPISGRAGLRLVDPGNIVHAADVTGLVVITQLQPIGVVFTLPEDDIPSVLDKLRPGVRLPVEAYDRDQQRKLTTGSLLTIDNQVDPATGTVRLKAVFPNADNRLFPSQFVNARLVLDVKRGATVVPAVAIQRSERGPSLYVVKPDKTVDVRQVTLGVADGDDVAIDKGLAVGELVVVDGPDRLGEGSRVSIQARRAS